MQKSATPLGCELWQNSPKSLEASIREFNLITGKTVIEKVIPISSFLRYTALHTCCR